MTDTVKTFVDEAQSFVGRHPELDEQQKSFGGLTWGLMRALAECPDCPGTFRVPLDSDWRGLFCPKCRNLWVQQEKSEQSPKKAKRRKAVS